MGPIDFLAFIVGLFFVLARFRFFFDPSKPAGARFFNKQRYDSLHSKIASCGWTKGTTFWTWYTAIVEVGAGLGLMFNIARPLSGLLMMGILLVATCCTCRTKVCEQKPVDKADVICAYLWRVEGLYIAMLAVVLWNDLGPFCQEILP